MIEFSRCLTTFEDMRMEDPFDDATILERAEEFHQGAWVGYIDDHGVELLASIRIAYKERLERQV